ncbi:cobalt-precorrin 5A hydrolase [Secundilactobacillus hailunensis]|uniref:Cobalt-precorrin 5A hydrolase n=1 Tax=Secundilactobacillus hailunensis TaxID=2559923 RepID=A0ABW1T7W8_9LACO|nr:cobalt-precorrin 5A hydrolase [Secundilactobacillus hailunensis]
MTSDSENGAVAVIALTKVGSALGRQLCAKNEQLTLVVPAKYAQAHERSFARGGFKTTFRELFRTMDCVVCIMATGIVVRTVSTLLVDKTKDPAVLVVDEKANHVISLLSGHVGGANAWTLKIAKLLGADPVITTATDTEHVQALDNLAKRVHGYYPEFKYRTKQINSLLAAGEPVEIYVAPAFKTTLSDLRGFHVLADLSQRDAQVPLVIVSDQALTDKFVNSVQVVPRVNVLGIGCRKAVSYDMMQQAFTEFCTQYQLSWRSICGISSIDRKQHENAIHYLADTLGISATFYSAAELNKVADHYPESKFVKQTVGVGNVANTSAEVLAGTQTLTPRFSTHEVTIALSRQNI